MGNCLSESAPSKEKNRDLNIVHPEIGSGKIAARSPTAVALVRENPAPLTNGRRASFPSPNVESCLRVFEHQELKRATGNFRDDALLGEGGFGRVYKGWLADGQAGEAVAVKVLNTEGLQGHNQWEAEVNFLGLFRHNNLVRLIGYCAEERERLLVYEFMPQRSLDYHLFKEDGSTLPWLTRIQVALGAARGLAYLHEGSDKQVIYRDFKASNILLDNDFTAKLSDFGLAKDGPEGDKSHVSTRVMGTYGYAAPEYIMTGHLTLMSDVYSFGVVLLELITGRRSMDKGRRVEEQNLVDWAKPYFADKRQLYKLMDPRLEGQYSIRGATKAALLAKACLSRDPKKRPLMSDVVDVLLPLQTLCDTATSYASASSDHAPPALLSTADSAAQSLPAPAPSRHHSVSVTGASSARAWQLTPPASR